MQFVSGTEYYFGEEGQVIVLLTNFVNKPVDANCSATVLYPNKTVFVNSVLMANQTSLGTYYTTFTVPMVVGVYEYMANCSIGNKNYVDGRSFHVSTADNITIEKLSRMRAILAR
jgi:hypothetical protein